SETATNPLRTGLRMERTPPPCVLIIFGASGDLTQRKLLPALWALAEEQQLGPGFSVIGVSRTPKTHEQFRDEFREALGPNAPDDEAALGDFLEGLFYLPGNIDHPDMYQELDTLLKQIDRERGTEGNRIFYLSTQPSFFPRIIRQLGATGLANRTAEGDGWTRVVIEKPFGRDLDSARMLNQVVSEVFDEHQVYRIDHYLGKETVQNLMVLRFANTIWEPIWNRRYVDHVQITVAERVGVEGRGGYYEEAGLLRDMIANHLLQLLTIVAMEPPVAFDADAVRDEKVKVLRAVRPFTSERIAADTVRGQYGPGFSAAEEVPGYRQEEKVSPQSTTETYAALRFFVDNWRWRDVPFLLRSGKRLPKRVSEIAIQFKPVPHLLFESCMPNVLAIRIQPDEGIALQFDAKVPGAQMRQRPVLMEFRYGTSFGVPPVEAYQRLLLDVMLGDSTLFARRDEVEAAWCIVGPILDAWESTPSDDFPNYEAGSWGPAAADALLDSEDWRWRRL
ncbi:MAG TPA: glucose-6-phosphate dehydrogenase, partial [Herpetosiphonaceae bacterium]|nr:glucose-6-phosphate dehydrogenase [Herpetosiphonaceae bacterium]